MQGNAPGFTSSRQVYRALDSVPSRNADVPGTRSLGRLGLQTLADDSNGPTISHDRETSCSPTSSEIDALEESFCDFGLEPSQVEGDSSQSSYSDMQTTTTVTSLSSRTSPAVSDHLDSLRPLSDSTCDFGDNRVMPLGDRLRLVWRMLPTSLSSHALF